MDTMIQSYMEETEDLLQRAEECIIKLEEQFTYDDINELFRIAHTIKGSSYMVGYEDLGNLMHKIEDMLDSVRNGSILFDSQTSSLCFEGIDIAKKILLSKEMLNASEVTNEYLDEASTVCKKIQMLVSKTKTKKAVTKSDEINTGIVSNLLNRIPKGKNKFYIKISIEEDTPMISPVFTLIFKCIENIGSLLYSSVTDDFLCSDADNDIRELEMILCTDIDEAELYTYFSLFYVEKINILNLNSNEDNAYYFNETDYTPYLNLLNTTMSLCKIAFLDINEVNLKQLQNDTADALGRLRNKAKVKIYNNEFNDLFNLAKKMLNAKAASRTRIKADLQEQLHNLIEKMYYSIKGKYIVRYIKLNQDNVISSLKNFLGLINKSSTFIILIDLCKLSILHEDEIKELISIINELQNQGIETGLVIYGKNSRKIINIFDSIQSEYKFNVFSNELDAIIRILTASDSFQKINS